MNTDIHAREIRLISSDGEQLGIVSVQAGIEKAKEDSLDLVEISPQAEPPVCKIMDFGKYIYQQNKKQGSTKKKQRQTQIKKMRVRPGIDIGDYQVKLRSVIRFLQDGDKVEISLRFRGRELAHRELGMELLERVQKDLQEFAEVEREPKFEGRQMIMVLTPKKVK